MPGQSSSVLSTFGLHKLSSLNLNAEEVFVVAHFFILLVSCLTYLHSRYIVRKENSLVFERTRESEGEPICL